MLEDGGGVILALIIGWGISIGFLLLTGNENQDTWVYTLLFITLFVLIFDEWYFEKNHPYPSFPCNCEKRKCGTKE